MMDLECVCKLVRWIIDKLWDIYAEQDRSNRQVDILALIHVLQVVLSYGYSDIAAERNKEQCATQSDLSPLRSYGALPAKNTPCTG